MRIKTIALAGLMTLGLGACHYYGPGYPVRAAAGAVVGATVGAVAGAAIGAATGGYHYGPYYGYYGPRRPYYRRGYYRHW
ncbi:hypothetical protein LNKW23_17630 [Paralimibaculum aggregatum]|uniref:Glycine zipper domain-containing protein n=1 Tax=Paralimibaculum aggregatum TaxID=3036245 RepID=A0ABQ6LJZ8_9RHOB|nr:hypothetical protein [Limibaculum sp. NKW23]GMG82550.1 hypothetical protein LNKW23_17630 [Limibaculum sp. NKW23]